MSTTTSTTPPRARKAPADRQPSKAEKARDAQLSEEKLLAGVPPMKDPTRLPFRARNRILLLSGRLEQMSGPDGTFAVDTKDVARMAEFLDLLADFADFAKTIALEPDQWDVWEETASYTQIGTLLAKYGRAVGESSGSLS